MKKLVIYFLVLAAPLFAVSQPPEGNANPGDKYGEIATTAGAINISEVPMLLSQSDSIQAKVKTKVIDVCPNKGCWLKVALNDSTEAFVRMKDYGFFTPLALKGKTIVMDAAATIKTTSVRELRHYAEDAKKTKQEILAITQPRKEVQFLASGIQVVE